MQLFHRHLNYCIHIKVYIYIYITNVLCKYYLYTNNIKLSVQITNKTWKIIFTNNDDEGWANMLDEHCVWMKFSKSGQRGNIGIKEYAIYELLIR